PGGNRAVGRHGAAALPGRARVPGPRAMDRRPDGVPAARARPRRRGSTLRARSGRAGGAGVRRGELDPRGPAPGGTPAVAPVASCGLAALHLGAGGARLELVEPGRDAVTIAYLRAFVASHPGDAAMRLRLGREELSLGRLRDADRTLTPLLAEAPAPEEA